MNRDRCPWCGKRIDHLRDSYAQTKKTPLFFRFARCHHCGHFYGQHVYSSKCMRIMFFSLLPTVILTVVFKFFPLALIYLFLGIFEVFFIPLSRMDEKEDLVEPDEALMFQAALLEDNHAVRKNRIYFLTENFDECDALSVVSPIYIEALDKKRSAVSGYFLYDHPQNSDYQEHCAVMLYDEDGSPVGKIQFLHV